MNEIREKVETILKAYITDYSSDMEDDELKDMTDVDSLVIFNILVDIEDCFNLKIGDDEDLENIFRTPKTIMQYVKVRL